MSRSVLREEQLTAITDFKPTDEELEELESFVNALEVPRVNSGGIGNALAELLDPADPKQRRAFQIAYSIACDYHNMSMTGPRQPEPDKKGGAVVEFTRRARGRKKDWETGDNQPPSGPNRNNWHELRVHQSRTFGFLDFLGFLAKVYLRGEAPGNGTVHWRRNLEAGSSRCGART